MKKFRFMCAVVLALVMGILLTDRQDSHIYQAATSYTDAKEFYETVENGQGYHAEMVNGSVYYATRAKTAHSSTNLRYRTIGFDISLSAGGVTVSFAVQRDDSSYLRNISGISDGTYNYNLYVIDEKALYELAELSAGKSAVEKLTAEAVVYVRMDAVLTNIRGTKMDGAVKENGQGGLTESGTVYHLKEEGDLKKMKDIFTGHDFDSYYNIEEDLENYALTLYFNVQGTDDDNIGCTSTVSVGNGYNVSNIGRLQYNGISVSDTYRVLQQFTLPDVTEKGIDLKKTGYHLPEGEEWKTSDGRTFSDSTVYMPKDIEPMAGFKSMMAVLYANWKPNTYTVIYNAAGGSGTVRSTTHTYDFSGTLSDNTFTRAGYYIDEDEAWVDEEGNTYPNGAEVLNWTDVNHDIIVLKANWKPLVVQITTERGEGSGGTEYFFEKYGIGFSFMDTFTSLTDAISIPYRAGYSFMGYFRNVFGMGDLIVDADGNIKAGADYFDKDSTIYAKYEALPFKITFDKQGGVYGSDSVIATYGDILPTADAPIRMGYTFQGYYSEADGRGEQYYNEYMSSSRIWDRLEDITLYAYWVDDHAPDVVLNVSCSSWTNQTVTLTAVAYDYGAGLDSLEIYRIYEDGATSLAASTTDLDGAGRCQLTYDNPIEGVIRYKAVAADVNGNTAESYNVVYYDITPPSGEVIEFVTNEDGSISIIVDVTDINTKQ